MARRSVATAALLAALAVPAGASAATYTTVDAPKAGAPFEVALDAQGDAYFTSSNSSFLTRVPADGSAPQAIAVPADGATARVTWGIVRGSDGLLYIGAQPSDFLLRFDPVAEAFLATHVPFASATPEGAFELVVGPDNRIWATSRTGQDFILSYTIGDANVKQYALPEQGNPVDLAFAPDGKLWITQIALDKVARIDTSDVDGTYNIGTSYQAFPVSELGAGSDPHTIRTGPDGNLWISLRGAGAHRIVKFSPTENKALAEYELTEGAGPGRGIVGPDGNLWFSEFGGSRLARITTAGEVAEYPLPGAVRPQGMAATADGKGLWVAEEATNRFGRLALPLSPAVTTGDATVLSTTSAKLDASVDAKTLACTFVVEYGTTTAYGSATPAATCGSADGPIGVSATLTSLAAGTTYHYRISATNAFGSAVGEDRTFSTPATPVSDADKDGIPAPADCDDNNPTVRPGAFDIPKNGIDEDCANGDAPYPLLAASPSVAWLAGPTTRFTRFRVPDLVGVESIEIRCRGRGRRNGGCPFKQKVTPAKRGVVKFERFFKKRRLRPRTVIEVRVTARLAIGRYLKLQVRRNRNPKVTRRCLVPGNRVPQRCP